MADERLLGIILACIVIILMLYKIYNRYSGLKAVELLLKEYYQEKGFQIISISKLKAADKIKYGVPFNPYISLYNSSFQIISALNEKYHRCVETSDYSGKEHIRYVEISFKSGKGMDINEFDTYEF
ncbi:hypothetical protein [uncultured Draconibacterium sp.]|uniref:hypothetical protein n=1 Tax=uncultured Draconibacterium sp. TaxID=1573823 RepID=UPI00321728AC